MYKSNTENTTRRKLCILCCLITSPQNGERGRGAYSRRDAYFKFWPLGGPLIRRRRLFEGVGALIRGFTVCVFRAQFSCINKFRSLVVCVCLVSRTLSYCYIVALMSRALSLLYNSVSRTQSADTISNWQSIINRILEEDKLN